MLSTCCFAGGGHQENEITAVTRAAIEAAAAIPMIRNTLIEAFLCSISDR